MRIFTPQITWHGGENGRNDPVLSVDFHPFCNVVATGGTDGEVRLWRLERGEGDAPRPVFMVALSIHERGVNCVRFSPGGTFLASGSDDGNACLWHIKPHVLASLCKSSDELADPQVRRDAWTKLTDDKQVTRTVLRGRGAEIYHLSWSATGEHIAAACISQCTQVWHVTRRGPDISGRAIATLDKHSHFVQGCVWDPCGAFLASTSADRSMRVFSARWRGGGATKEADAVQKRLALSQTSVVKYLFFSEDKAANVADKSKGGEATTEEAPQRRAKAALFADETLPSFFRRMDWTPDGAALIVPAGVYRKDPEADPQFSTHIFARGDWASGPIATLPSESPSVAVRVCPTVFGFHGQPASHAGGGEAPEAAGTAQAAPHAGGKPEKTAEEAERIDGEAQKNAAAPLDEEKQRRAQLPPAPEGAWTDLPHRNVFAILTVDGIFIYDSAHAHPLTVAHGLHYANMTDAAWSSDGRKLLVSSRDGYVTMLEFDDGELGPPVPLDALPKHMREKNHVDEALQLKYIRAQEEAAKAAKAALEAAQIAAKEQEKPQEEGEVTQEAAPSGDAQASQQVAVDTTVAAEGAEPAKKKKRITPQLLQVVA